MVLTAFLYYEDRDPLEDVQTGLYHQAMASFDGNAPSYHIELHDQPVLFGISIPCCWGFR